MKASLRSRDGRSSSWSRPVKSGFQRTSRTILIGLALGGAFLTVATRQTVVEQRRSAAAVNHAQETLERLQEMLFTIKDAETGQRGFLLTGEDEYLAPYQRAAGVIDQRVSELTRSMSGDPVQIRRLDEIRALLERKMAELGETIQLRRTTGLAAALSLVQTGEGRKSMTELERVAREIKQQEIHTLQARMAAQQRAEAQLSAVISIAVLLFFGLLAALTV